jgi:hypothetical protein
MEERFNSHFRPYLEPFLFDWSAFVPHEALLCLPAITIIIFSGVMAHHPGAGLIAGGEAVSVGFGSFQRVQKSRVAPMLLARVVIVLQLAARELRHLCGMRDVLYRFPPPSADCRRLQLSNTDQSTRR